MSQGSMRCYRSGKYLVVRNGTDLGGRCIKCGEPAVKAYDRDLYWHHPVWFILAPFGLLLYAIIALAIRKSCSVRVGLCTQHKRRRLILILTAWLVLVVGVGVLIAGLNQLDSRNSDLGGILTISGTVVILGAAVAGAVMSTWICSCKRITDRHTFVKGVGLAVLEDFEDLPAGA